LAMSAMAVSAAHAEEVPPKKGKFTGGSTGPPVTHVTTTLSGVQEGTEAENFFQIEGEAGPKVACENAGVSYAGTLETGEATEVIATPTYNDCKGEGLPATVTMNGCTYRFTQPSTIEPFGTGKYTGKADLTCPENKAIDIKIFLFGTPQGTH